LLNPNDSAIVETSHRSFFTDLDHHSSFIETESNIVRFRKTMDSPNPLKTIVQEGFQLESDSVPNIDDTILTSRDDDR